MINILLWGNIVMTYDDSELMGVAIRVRGATPTHYFEEECSAIGREVKGKPHCQTIVELTKSF